MSAPVIPGVPTDGLKPADLLWASILSKPLLFPPSPHSHGSADLPVTVARTDLSNTFTQNQLFHGNAEVAGLLSVKGTDYTTRATINGNTGAFEINAGDYQVKLHGDANGPILQSFASKPLQINPAGNDTVFPSWYWIRDSYNRIMFAGGSSTYLAGQGTYPVIHRNASGQDVFRNQDNGDQLLRGSLVVSSGTSDPSGSTATPAKAFVDFRSGGWTYSAGRIEGRTYAANLIYGDLVLSANPSILITDGSNLSNDLAIRGNTGNVELSRATRLTFLGPNSGYRTAIENNWDSGRAFAITAGGYDVIKCSSDVYNSLTIGHSGTQNVNFPGVSTTFAGTGAFNGLIAHSMSGGSISSPSRSRLDFWSGNYSYRTGAIYTESYANDSLATNMLLCANPNLLNPPTPNITIAGATGNVTFSNGATFSGTVRLPTGTWHTSTESTPKQRLFFSVDATSYYQGHGSFPHIFRNGAGTDRLTIRDSGTTLIDGPMFVGSGTGSDGRRLISPNYDGSANGHFASGLVAERGSIAIGLAWGMYQDNTTSWLSGWDYGALSRTALLNDFAGLRYITTDATTAAPGSVLPSQPTTKFSVSPTGALTTTGPAVFGGTMACQYGMTITELGTSTMQWLLYKNAGVGQPLYIRDMVNSHNHVIIYPGATSYASTVGFESHVVVNQGLQVASNASHIGFDAGPNNYLGGITYFRPSIGGAITASIDGTTGIAAFGGQAIADSLAVTTSARIGAGALGGLLYFGNGSNWIFQDSNSFHIDSNGGGVQFRNALTALPYFRVTAAGHVTTWGAIDSTGSVNSNRSLSLGNDNLGAETITFVGVIPAYRTVIENNWNSDRSFAITNGGYDVFKCSNGGYTSITIGSDITQSTIIKGNPQAVGFTAIEPGKGAAAIAAGGFSGTGFFAWFKPGGTRQGYVGFDSGENIGFVNERSGGIFTFNAAVEVASHVTAGFQSLSADPTTLDLTAGQSRLVKNTTSGLLRLWANDGGTMKSVTLT
ncbi:hypothetical protein [Flavobacterium sp.]|jgi:hypothetical protein|uniref:hypothetical protein n=1 Tax=Flavobacterium sp. TaxID=239 RepID=UPI0037C18629